MWRMSVTSKNTSDSPKPYTNDITPKQAASAMQAARMNAVELMDTAEILYNLKRFSHSLVFSTLAIEEAGKLPILQTILCGYGDKRSDLWRSFRSHRAKTGTLNIGIFARVRVEYPEISIDDAKEIANRGPTPDDLENDKQHAIYSDCLEISEEFVCHLPKNVDWRKQAFSRLSEARAIISPLKDRTPEELAVWKKHAKEGRALGKKLADILPDIYKELSDKGFVEREQSDPLLKDIETLSGDAGNIKT
jgi:AbiV family abortive infection protein